MVAKFPVLEQVLALVRCVHDCYKNLRRTKHSTLRYLGLIVIELTLLLQSPLAVCTNIIQRDITGGFHQVCEGVS